jgi:Flp pilus assembly protein TadG
MASLRQRLHRRRRSERGAELIELAIVLPILLLILAGIFDFGFLFQRWEALTNAAREGARLGTLPTYTTSDVQARVTSYLTASGMTPALATINVAYSNQAVSVGGPTISVVTVTVTYPAGMGSLGVIAGMVGGSQGPITLQAVSVMRLETPMAAGS